MSRDCVDGEASECAVTLSSGGEVQQDARIYVAGHRGLLGSGLVRALEQRGYHNLVLAAREEVDLRVAPQVEEFLAAQRPEFVFVAAAKAGGILANGRYPATFLYDNLLIAANIIHAAYACNVRKLLFLASSAVYPRLAPQPLKEDALLTGPLEPTNQWYAIAKLAGIKLCQAYYRQYRCRFIAALATNLYGPGDDFDLESSHVVAGLIRKFHEAKVVAAPHVVVWGSGAPQREFCYVDDCAEACLRLMESYDRPEVINVGGGQEIRIRDLAQLVQRVVGYRGDLIFDTTKPDGPPRKLLDSTRIFDLGWRPRVALEAGIRLTYDWYLREVAYEHRALI